ncbi:MAG: SDR family NAD(P)-dependent oxidoreductase [Gammaproteobacteria bacterium]|nr:SDR family NAD(P)-dependent oxidoreductase [Gammaproteobacteria bacterium]
MSEKAGHSGDDIAVISMAGRFPGANDISQFWKNLCNGVDSISNFTEEDLLAAGVDPLRLKEPDYINAAGVIENIEYFDAQFFNISPKEARLLDPQRRLFLECAWEALENAGYAPGSYNGYTGVFAGANMSTYLLCNLMPGLQLKPPLSDFRLYVGNDKDFFSTYVSYKFDLKGPSVSVQTACSSSLVAVHMACQSLSDGQCDMALAGGVGIFHPQKSGFPADDMVIFSRDGCCRAFDADASGTVLGNGVGIVVLKRLDDALADQDYIHAVIKGTAINNDGTDKVGYTAPSVQGQAEVIAEALAVSGTAPKEIGYIETHGTGTSVGDLIEFTALMRAFGPISDDKHSCAIGSVKTNIGHLWSAAGIAGFIKAVLTVEHGSIPPSLNYVKPNPNINFRNSPFYVNTTLSDWPLNGPRKACISSFGIGGTNAHVVIEEAPGHACESRAGNLPFQILTLSAKSEEALEALAQRYVGFLQEGPQQEYVDVCYTASTGRAHFERRMAIVAQSGGTALSKLEQHLAGDKGEIFENSGKTSLDHLKLAFIFPDRVAVPESEDMIEELYHTQPAFRDALDKCRQWSTDHLGVPIPLIPLEDCSVNALTDQMACRVITAFAVQYSLAMMWVSWRVMPDAVTGVGTGEYVAACVAGIFSPEDALALLAREAQPDQSPGGLHDVIFRQPGIKYVSCYRPEPGATSDVANSDYWCKRRDTTQHHAQAIERLREAGIDTLLRLADNGSNLVRRVGDAPLNREDSVQLFNAIDEEQSTRESLANSLAYLYAGGINVEWKSVYSDCRGYRVAVPTYPFQRSRYWVDREPESQASSLPKSNQPAAYGGLLKMRRVRSPLREIQFEFNLSNEWLDACEPGNGGQWNEVPMPPYMEYVQYAAKEAFGKGRYEFIDIAIESNASLIFEQDQLCSLILTSSGEGVGSFQIFALDTEFAQDDSTEASWRLLCTGKCVRKRIAEQHYSSTGAIAAVQSRCKPVGGSAVAEKFRDPWGVDEIFIGTQEALWRFALQAHIPAAICKTYPGSISLHAAIEVLSAILNDRGHEGHWVVSAADSCQVEAIVSQQMWVEARWWQDGRAGFYANLKIRGDQEDTLITIDGLHLVPADTCTDSYPMIEADDWYYQLDWNKSVQGSSSAKDISKKNTVWVLLRQSMGAGSEFAQVLHESGEICIEVEPGENYRKKDRNHYQIDPASEADYTHLFQDIGASIESTMAGFQVIHLWGGDVKVSDEECDLSDELHQLFLSNSALCLVKAAKKARETGACNMWFVTCGAQLAGTGDTVVQPFQRSLWGLGRVIRSECPTLWGGLVDLDPDNPEKNWLKFIEDVRSGDGEDEIAYRGEARFTARLVRKPVEPCKKAEMNPDATYLITGGLGGLGLEVAQWMANEGVQQLVLMGRNGPSQHAKDILKALEDKGCNVLVELVDICDSSALARSLKKIANTLPPMRGIVHAAGVLDDALLTMQDWERFQRVLKPKVSGSWNLHVLTQALPLDFFAFFSSIAPVFGSPGQANYAAANEFMDGLAMLRCSKKMPAISINWGPWSDVGMAHRLGDMQQRRLAKLGIECIAPEIGLGIFGNLLTQDKPNIMVLNVDWHRLFPQLPAGQCPALLGDLLHSKNEKMIVPGKVEGAEEEVGALRDEKEGVQGRGLDSIRGFLHESISKVLGLKKDELSFDMDPINFGMDSLRFMEVINDVKREFGITVYPNEFMKRPSVNGMASYLLAELETVGGKSKAEEAIVSNRRMKDSRGGDNAVREPCFILSSPRSGSTLLRVMLAGNQGLFCPPELHLLPFENMGERAKNIESYLGEGLERAIMELNGVGAEQAKDFVKKSEEQNASIETIYSVLQKAARGRRLVDKSPSYGADIQILERSRAMFKDARYIFLVRHPYSVIESFVRNRMDKLLNMEGCDTDLLAEQVWATINTNVFRFLESRPSSHWKIVHYEDLVTRPEAVMRDMCKHLGVTFNPAMLEPYQEGRMTDGVHASSMQIGDPNFMHHDGIDEALADVWKNIKLPITLQETTVRLAERLGYELPGESGAASTNKPGKVQPLVEIHGKGELPPIFCLHPSGGQVYAYHHFKQVFGEERPIFGIQSVALDDSKLEHKTLESMVEEYVQVVIQRNPVGPYYLLGWSLGGRLALAMARELERRGTQASFVGIIDSRYPPNDASSLVGAEVPEVSMAFGGRLIETIAKLPENMKEEVEGELRQRTGDDRLKWVLSWAQKQGALPPDLPLDMLYEQAALVDRHVELLKAHVPQAVNCPLHVWWAQDGLKWRAPTDWGEYTFADVYTSIIDGNHFSMMKPPNVYLLAKQVRDFLSEIESREVGEGGRTAFKHNVMAGESTVHTLDH